MKFKIEDEVETHKDFDRRYGFNFEGIIDDIQGNIVSVYGNVTNGLGKSDDKYLRDFHIREIVLLDEWFEEVCWVCEKEKLVHNDERATLIDPGFICKECEENRQDFEKFMENLLFEDIGVN